MNEEERQSQVSALFDGALDDGQTDLVVRRILKDPQLAKAWSRYALIGASIRGEPLSVAAGPRGDVADRVRAALDLEAPLEAAAVAPPAREPEWNGTAQRALWGTALVAGVAAMAILVLRLQGDPGTAAMTALVTSAAQTAPEEAVPLQAIPAQEPRVAAASRAPAAGADVGEAPSYTTPVASGNARNMSAPLVSYVVAHSEYLTPVMRFNPLSAAMMGGFEPGEELVEATEAEIGAARR